jgi:hypothetical protein
MPEEMAKPILSRCPNRVNGQSNPKPINAAYRSRFHAADAGGRTKKKSHKPL